MGGVYYLHRTFLSLPPPKAREREFAKFDANRGFRCKSRSSGNTEPLPGKNEHTYRGGGGGGETWDSSLSRKMEVKQKKKKKLDLARDWQDFQWASLLRLEPWRMEVAVECSLSCAVGVRLR